MPVWIVAIRDPAYAYMLRSSGSCRPHARFRRRRTNRTPTGYAPLGEPMPQATPEELQTFRAQAEADTEVWLARLHDVENRHGELLRETAAVLTRGGAATLRTSAGNIRARIIRFRKEAVVLEILFPGGRIQSRSTAPLVRDQAVHQLANALVAIRPEAEPLA